MLSNLYSLNNDFFNYWDENTTLKSIDSNIILDINNNSHIITITYGIDIKTFISNIYFSYNKNIRFEILSKDNYIKLYGQIENGDSLIVLLNNTQIIKYKINVLAIVDAKYFNILDFYKNNNVNLKICFDNLTSKFIIGDTKCTTINGDVILSGYLNKKQIIDLKNVIINGNLFVNIHLGHINLNNVKAKNVIVLSAGSKSVSFKDNSSVNTITVLTKTPVRITSDPSVSIKNINLSPTGDSLNKNRIILDGTFFTTNISIQSSLILEGGPSLQIFNPIYIKNNNFNDQINFKGNFKQVKNIIVENPVTILGDFQNPPKGINIEIATNTFNNPVFLKGNLSLSTILISTNSSIVCDGTFNTINVMDAEKVFLQLDTGTTINDFNCYTIVRVSGTEDAINNLLSNSHVYDKGRIIIDAVFRTIYLTNGHGIINTTISTPGKFDIVLNVKENNDILTLSKKINVTIHPNNS